MRAAPFVLTLMALLAAPGCVRSEVTQRPAPAPQPPPRDVAASGCSGDGDCALIRVEPGACCQSCQARAVTRAELLASEAHEADCRARGFRCAYPVCAPERRVLRPACERGACVLRAESGD